MHWRRKWQPTPVFLPGESQGQRSPVGHSPWCHTHALFYSMVLRFYRLLGSNANTGHAECSSSTILFPVEPGNAVFSVSNRASQVGQMQRTCLPVQETQETWVRSLSQKDPLGKEMATHASILVWEIPWTKEPGRLQSLGSQNSWTQLSD